MSGGPSLAHHPVKFEGQLTQLGSFGRMVMSKYIGNIIMNVIAIALIPDADPLPIKIFGKRAVFGKASKPPRPQGPKRCFKRMCKVD